MIKLILFDVGGTLVSSDDIFERALVKIGSENADIYDFLKIRFAHHKGRRDRFLTVREILAECLREAAHKFGVKDISNDSAKLYAEVFLGSRAFDDTVPVLEKLRGAGIKLSIASDADEEVLMEELEKIGILKYFGDFFVSSELGAYKPSDVVVQRILESCNCKRDEMLFVGDSADDIETARKMGVKSVLIEREGRLDCRPDYRIGNLGDLLKVPGLGSQTR
jgi:2-haloacid dehalogenase